MDEEVVPEFLELLRSTFPDTPFKTTRALPYIIEIVAETVDKSQALAYFCNKFNIKPENVMTFVCSFECPRPVQLADMFAIL